MAVALAPVGSRLGVIWLESAGRGAQRLVFASTDGVEVSPAHVVSAGRRFFANWADTPQLAATSDGAIVVTWLQRSAAGTYDYDVVAAASADAGQTWCEPIKVNDDVGVGEHGFVSLVPVAGGVRAFWLDGRAMAAAPHGDSHDHAPNGGGMQVRTTTLRFDSGELTVAPSQELDDRVCECCPTAAVAAKSGFVVAYRDRQLPDELRDIGVVRSQGLATPAWEASRVPLADGWKVSGCPVNGPAMDSISDAVVMVWPTGVKDQPSLQCAFSSDGGGSWGKAMAVEPMFAPGRPDVVMLPTGEAVVAWLGVREDSATSETAGVLRLRRLRADGGMGAVLDLAPMGLDRRSGYPRLARVGDSLIVTWTVASEDGEGTTALRAMNVPVAEVPAPSALFKANH